jgi:hypothetical protein
MTGPHGERHVTFVTSDGHVPAIAHRGRDDGWQVRVPRTETWRMVIVLPGSPPFVFDSSETARAWAEETIDHLTWFFRPEPPAGASEAAPVLTRERAAKSTKKFLAWAERNGLDPRQAETVQRAHDESIIGSVCLWSLPGCEGECVVVDQDVPDLKTIVDWDAKSCSGSTALLYADTDGWNADGVRTGVSGRCDDLPHDVRSLRVY